MRGKKKKKRKKYQNTQELIWNWKNMNSVMTIPNEHMISPAFTDGT